MIGRAVKGRKKKEDLTEHELEQIADQYEVLSYKQMEQHVNKQYQETNHKQDNSESEQDSYEGLLDDKKYNTTEEELLFTQEEELHNPELRKFMHTLRKEGIFKYSNEKVKRAIERSKVSGKIQLSEDSNSEVEFVHFDPQDKRRRQKYFRRKQIKLQHMEQQNLSEKQKQSS